MVKNFIDKYLILKKEDTTHFYLIIPRNDMYFLVNGTSVKAEIQVVHCKNTGEALKEINAFVLSKRKQGYRDETRPEDISVFSIALEQLKTENAKEFEEKLLVLKMLTDAYYTREEHPFVKYLEVDMKDEELVTTPILDEYLQKHIDALSSRSLVHVFQMTLQNIYFNFEATSFAVKEITKRKDLSAQLEIVEQFYKACEYYDAGHRFWSNTNQDELIDTYFPEFESEALLKILEKASEDMLKSDEMDELFVPALRGTEDKNLQLEILNVLTTYKKEYEEYVEEEYFDALFEKILESASTNVKQGIERIKEGKKKKRYFTKSNTEKRSRTNRKILGSRCDTRRGYS